MEATPNVDGIFHDQDNADWESRQIAARIDDLRRGGCNQQIAWSKLGCIAIINAQGTGIEIRHLASNPKDGNWRLSDAYPIPNVSKEHEGQRIQHVTWSVGSGADLAVVDVMGRVSFYTVFLAVNALALTSMHSCPEDDLNALVGFWWLPSDKPSAVHKGAERQEDGSFQYSTLSFKPSGPFHPVLNKAAAIGITRGGIAKLWFHDAHGRYSEVDYEEPLISLDELLSHASICWHKDNVAVLVCYTTSGQLRMYRIAVSWTTSSHTAKPPHQSQFPTSPVLRVKRIKQQDITLDPVPNHESAHAQLSFLEILAPLHIARNTAPVPTILAVYSGNDSNSLPFSIIARWDLLDRVATLSPSFDQLSVKRTGHSSVPTTDYELRRLNDFTIAKWVIGVWVVMSGSVVAIAFSDGTLDFRSRHDFSLLSDEPFDKDSVSNMIQAGFSFPAGGPSKNLALSPNNTVLIRIDPEDEVHMSVMGFTKGSMDDPDNVKVSCVALAMQHAYSCNNFLNNDDLLLVTQRYSKMSFNQTLMTEIHSSLSLKLDFSVESPNERLIRNPLLQRCLSLQYALDFQGEFVTKTLSAKLAWATLHLRVASLAFGVTYNSPQRQPRPPGSASELDIRPDGLQTLMGLLNWFVDMISFIVSDLFELAKATQGRANDIEHVTKMMLQQNSPALLLALASAPRSFLRYNCRSLRGLETHVKNQLKSGARLEDDIKVTYKSFNVPLETCVVKIAQFERIMTDIDGTVRAAYHGAPDTDRLMQERQLFLENKIPATFQEPVERILTNTLPALRKEIDVAALFWRDVAWLGFHDDVGSQEWHRTHKVDALRKIVLSRSAQTRLRRCMRCCSIVEELPPQKTQANWLSTVQRMCLCGNLWMRLGNSPKE